MISIGFDPTNENDMAFVRNLIAGFDAATPPGAQPDPENIEPYGAQNHPLPDTPGVIDPKAGVELDANGTPWIADVHAGTKSKKADGTWTKKRGVDDDVLHAAEEAARAKINGTPEAPDLPPVQVEQETVPPIEMQTLVAKCVEVIDAGLVTADDFVGIYEQYGTNVTDLTTNETARRAVYDHLSNLTAPTLPGLPG